MVLAHEQLETTLMFYKSNLVSVVSSSPCRSTMLTISSAVVVFVVVASAGNLLVSEAGWSFASTQVHLISVERQLQSAQLTEETEACNTMACDGDGKGTTDPLETLPCYRARCVWLCNRRDVYILLLACTMRFVDDFVLCFSAMIHLINLRGNFRVL